MLVRGVSRNKSYQYHYQCSLSLMCGWSPKPQFSCVWRLVSGFPGGFTGSTGCFRMGGDSTGTELMVRSPSAFHPQL